MARAFAPLAALLLAAVPPARAEGTLVRLAEDIIAVGIAHRVPRITFLPQGEFRVIDQSSGEIRRLESGRSYTVEADAGGKVLLGPHLFGGPTRLLPGKPEEFVLVGDRKFRGNLLFQPNRDDETLTVIDELGIEDYLYGVLPREMSAEWPLEALKAQAVVARTFALNNLGRHQESGYDLTDDVQSQVYGGITVESERVRDAVKRTEGETLYWKGERVRVYFHSACGGRTAAPEEVWGGEARSPRPLRGVRSRYCRYTPQYDWTASFRNEDVARTLQRRGWNVLRVDRIRVGRRGDSGRALTLDVHADGRWRAVRAGDLRLWLGATQVKSTMITHARGTGTRIELRGRGYGHGVGLCQWGARVMAERGRGYRDILDHYFPGAKIVKWLQ